MIYDAIVVGLGGMGSATLAHCAARGMRTLGIERFSPLHARGASHGRTRMIRQAYFEGAAYVPLLRRAYDLWDALEQRTATVLRARTGGVFVGTPDQPVVSGTLASARAQDLPHEVLDARALRRLYPQLRPRVDEIAVFEAVAGALFPERCIRALLETAIDDGAQARFGASVGAWSPEGRDRVAVRLDEETIHTRRLLLCPGAWFEGFATGVRVPLSIERNVQFWFAPVAPGEVGSDRLPVFGIGRAEWPFMFYGFPDFGDGVKCGFHHSGNFMQPGAPSASVSPQETAAVYDALSAWIPAAAGSLRLAVTCTYALTADENFIIGVHPEVPEVILAGGFSGHGFKFAPVVGEIVAELAATGVTRHDIAMFSPTRFSEAVAP